MRVTIRRATTEDCGAACEMPAGLHTPHHDATGCELNVWDSNRGAVQFYQEIGYSVACRRMWKRLDGCEADE